MTKPWRPSKAQLLSARLRKWLTAFVLLCCVVGCSHVERDAVPLRNAHAHNDYAHGRPLTEALESGFCSIEADIALAGGEIMVTHDPKRTTPGRTFERLYLDPLRKRVATHGGRVYRDGPGVILLIDFKSDPNTLYPALRKLLRRYADILTAWHDGQTRAGAVTILLTGNHPPASAVMAERVRYVAIDGKTPDIDSDIPADVMPQISIDWRSQFKWNGFGSMPAIERARLRTLVEQVHAHGRTIRLWAAPDQPRAWNELLDAHVDFINSDDLLGLRRFLLERATTRPCTRTAPAGFPPDPGNK